MILEKNKKKAIKSFLENVKACIIGTMAIDVIKNEGLIGIFEDFKNLKAIQDLTLQFAISKLTIEDDVDGDISIVTDFLKTLNGIESAGVAVSVYKDGTLLTITKDAMVIEDDTVIVLASNATSASLKLVDELGLNALDLKGNYEVVLMKCTSETVEEVTTYTVSEPQIFEFTY